MIRGLRFTTKGSERSGHHGHAGRPGSVGGSAPSGSSLPAGAEDGLKYIRSFLLTSQPGTTNDISPEGKAFLDQTVEKDEYEAYRGLGLVKHKVPDVEQRKKLNRLKEGDPIPGFLEGRPGQDISSFTTKKSVARAYTEGDLSIVIKSTIPRSQVLCDTRNLEKILKKYNQNILGETDFAYFKTEAELLTWGRIPGLVSSIKGQMKI